MSSETPDSSESSDQDNPSRIRKLYPKHQTANIGRKKFGNSIQHQQLIAQTLQHPLNLKHMTQEMFMSLKQRNAMGENNFGSMPEDESSLDVSSPREINSPSFGLLAKNKDTQDKLNRKREKQKAKEDEKMEKRRLKVRTSRSQCLVIINSRMLTLLLGGKAEKARGKRTRTREKEARENKTGKEWCWEQYVSPANVANPHRRLCSE